MIEWPVIGESFGEREGPEIVSICGVNVSDRCSQSYSSGGYFSPSLAFWIGRVA